MTAAGAAWGLWCGRDERSIRLGSPVSRNRFSRLQAVRTPTRQSEDAGSLSRCFDAQTIVETLNQKDSTPQGKTGMFVPVHPGILKGCVVRTSRTPEMTPMNNLPRDHA